MDLLSQILLVLFLAPLIILLWVGVISILATLIGTWLADLKENRKLRRKNEHNL